MPHECTTCGRQFDDGSKEMLSGCPNCGGNKFQFQPPGRDTAEASSTSSDATPAEPEAPDSEPPEPAGAAEPESTGPDRVDPESVDAEPTDLGEQSPDRTPEPAAEVDAGGEIDAGAGEDRARAEDRAQTDARSSSASVDEIDDARRTMSEAEKSSDAESPARGTPQGPPRDTPSDVSADEFDISGAVGPEDDDVEKQPVAGSAPEHEEPDADDTDLGTLREELNDQFESIKITAPGQYELNLMELYDRKEYIISLQEDGRYVIEMADDYGIDE
ncbi:OapC/ArvC family zinc-ribbon domain-containing protein [Halolamina sp. C58]|uniref:OapC/ArvC family zinc-ribbon domain-containing protein n=1 Tax=Halolamina sp. C58 TaxID=3421640 RepID=UPI003EBD34A0